MGYSDFPFLATGKADRDSRRFPRHQEVLKYLEDFARQFRLNELVRYQTEVLHVGLGTDRKWTVRSKRKDENDGNEVEEIYDAVVVCSGKYTEPRIADIPGIELWPGRQIHSHNYRIPDPYRGLVVVVIGNSTSATDICRDIVGVAKEVHVASRYEPEGSSRKHPGHANLWIHPVVKCAHKDGTVTFQDGTMVIADVILHCTGYKYHFPFLHLNGDVNVDDNRVGPLYKHIFPPALAPGLSFVGLPWKVISAFLLSELQSKWIAGILSGRISLPSEGQMMEDVEAFYSKLDAAGVPKRYTHNISDYLFEYHHWLAAESGCPSIEEWRNKMIHATWRNRETRPETCRDEWEDDELILQAHQDFIQYLPPSTL